MDDVIMLYAHYALLMRQWLKMRTVRTVHQWVHESAGHATLRFIISDMK